MARRDGRVSWEVGRWILWEPPCSTWLVYYDTRHWREF